MLIKCSLGTHTFPASPKPLFAVHTVYCQDIPPQISLGNKKETNSEMKKYIYRYIYIYICKQKTQKKKKIFFFFPFEKKRGTHQLRRFFNFTRKKKFLKRYCFSMLYCCFFKVLTVLHPDIELCCLWREI